MLTWQERPREVQEPRHSWNPSGSPPWAAEAQCCHGRQRPGAAHGRALSKPAGAATVSIMDSSLQSISAKPRVPPIVQTIYASATTLLDAAQTPAALAGGRVDTLRWPGELSQRGSHSLPRQLTLRSTCSMKSRKQELKVSQHSRGDTLKTLLTSAPRTHACLPQRRVPTALPTAAAAGLVCPVHWTRQGTRQCTGQRAPKAHRGASAPKFCFKDWEMHEISSLYTNSKINLKKKRGKVESFHNAVKSKDHGAYREHKQLYCPFKTDGTGWPNPVSDTSQAERSMTAA